MFFQFVGCKMRPQLLLRQCVCIFQSISIILIYFIHNQYNFYSDFQPQIYLHSQRQLFSKCFECNPKNQKQMIIHAHSCYCPPSTPQYIQHIQFIYITIQPKPNHPITNPFKMFNNYTDDEIAYQSCTIVQPASNGNGALLIGDFNSATDAQKIKQYNIKTIITAAVGMEHLQVPNSVVHITYPLLDANSQNIKRFFDESTTTIKNSLKNGSVLVHCAAGISRSATLVLAYMMKTRKISFRQAISIVRQTRNVRPNLGFERQLKQYQKQTLEPQEGNKLNLKKTITQKMANQRRTLYNRSSHLGRLGGQDFLKFQPRTAQQLNRRKNEQIKRIHFPHSQSRPRQRKNFKVRPIGGKQDFFVLGQAPGMNINININGNMNTKQSKQLNLQDGIGYSQQIKPPIIQNHHKNALNNGWLKFQIKKHY